MKKTIQRAAKWLSFPAIALVSFSVGSFLNAGTLPVDESLVDFHTVEGRDLLFTSNAKEDYSLLSQYFVTQINSAYCGVASMAIVLNSLGIDASIAPELQKKRFTQTNIFTEQTEEIHPADKIRWQGMTLSQLGQLLSTYPVDVDVIHGDELSLPEFRELLRQNLSEPNNFVLVNYLRSAINQKTGGHISPIAAYNETGDRFLILDVSTYKYPPVWVAASDLWEATITIDSSVNQSRGIVTVEL